MNDNKINTQISNIVGNSPWSGDKKHEMEFFWSWSIVNTTQVSKFNSKTNKLCLDKIKVLVRNNP